MERRNSQPKQQSSGKDNMGFVDEEEHQVYKLPSKRAQILIQKERYKSQNYFDFNCVNDWDFPERPTNSHTTYNHTLPKGRRQLASGRRSRETSQGSYPDLDVSGTPNHLHAHAEQNTRTAHARSWNVSSEDDAKKNGQADIPSARSQSMPYTGTLTKNGTLRAVNIPLDQSQFHQVGTFSRSATSSVSGEQIILVPESDKVSNEHKTGKVAKVDNRPQKNSDGNKERVLERKLANFARQLSRQQSYTIEESSVAIKDSGSGGVEPPKTYFDLALFTCACCLSPLGLLAVIFSVLSRNAHAEGLHKRSKKYRNAALGLSISGILLTIAGVIILLLIFAYPVIDLGSYFFWDNKTAEQMASIGGTSRPDGFFDTTSIPP